MDSDAQDYNNRQLSLMTAYLSGYDGTIQGLGRMVNGLDSLLNAMEHMSAAWIDQFRQNWGILEDTYSVALFYEWRSIDEASQKTIEHVISVLSQVISQTLATNSTET